MDPARLEKYFYLPFSLRDLIIFWSLYRKETETGAKYGLPRLSLNESAGLNTRADGTLFIFGSGSSINNLGIYDWEKINSHCSIGINLWIVHPFEPTYLMIEGGGLKDIQSPIYPLIQSKIYQVWAAQQRKSA